MTYRPKVCIDFDGVLNTYTGWKGENELYKPRIGTEEFLQTLHNEYTVTIFTTRNKEKIQDWLEKHCLDIYVDRITNIKEPALAYIDDRAICFNGDYEKTMNELRNFRAHWEK